MSESVDFLIVGGGISGRLIQAELIRRGCSPLVYDCPENNRSTLIAAGLANPLVGKFFTIGWRASEFFGGLDTFYEKLENRLGATFFRPRPMKRIISTAGEQNMWLSKAHKKKYVGFCEFVNEEVEGLNTEYGMLKVSQGGELNTERFLQACQAMPTVFEWFDHNKLDLNANKYDDIEFKSIVFAEGYELVNNPLFEDVVKLIPTKGEILELETDLHSSGDIYLGGVFLQHVREKLWRVGATYKPNDTTLNPTEEMKNDLISKLDKLIAVPYNVVNHKVGIRPASEDRKPLLGRHPNHKNAYLFNGMGSKAVSLAPLLATEMCDFILNDTPLQREVDITRFEE
ncbi:MAG: NAD(P)/FAD-dependent oxidoreductase [Bacteroidia bacterium]